MENKPKAGFGEKMRVQECLAIRLEEKGPGSMTMIIPGKKNEFTPNKDCVHSFHKPFTVRRTQEKEVKHPALQS